MGVGYGHRSSIGISDAVEKWRRASAITAKLRRPGGPEAAVSYCDRPS